MFKSHSPVKIFALVLGDIIMIVCAFALSSFTRFGQLEPAWAMYRFSFLSVIIFYPLIFYAFNLYEQHQRYKSSYFLSRFVVSVVLGFLITAILSYSIPSLKVGRGLSLLAAVYIMLLVPLWRFIFEDLFVANLVRKRIVIVGAGRVGRYISAVIKGNRNFEVIGFVDDDEIKHNTVVQDVRVLGGSNQLLLMAKNEELDIVVVAINTEKKKLLLDHLLLIKMDHVEIVDVATLYEEVTGKIPVAHLRLGWIVFTSFRAMSRHLYVHSKRYFDIFLSLFGLIISLPILLIVAALIKLDFPKGHVLYKQRRRGEGGKEFLMYKFRSMKVGSEKGEGGLYTSTNDPRITKVGRIIRKIRFDELPQLWNILIGNMSFVGPRPEAMELSQNYEKLIPYYSLRHIVRPGLTGWAQVRYSYSASTEDALEKFKYDMYYLKNMSFFLDIQIILKTISVIVFREFSR